MDQLEKLERRLTRATRARKEAERLLEEKAAELYEANQQLQSFAQEKSREADIAVEDKTKAEQRLWEALEAIPMGFSVFSADHKLSIANAAYFDLYRKTGLAFSEGVDRSDIMRAAVTNGILEIEGDLEDWLSEQREGWDSEDTFTKIEQFADGRWYRIVNQRTASGALATYRVDITEEIERQEELKVAKTQAEAANRAKSIFLANMSHEIRTPMNGVIGMADLLMETELSKEQSLFARTIKNSGEALLVIINDILDYSKIEAEQMELFPEPFNLEECIYEATMLLENKAQDKGLDLLIDYDMFLPNHFVGDSGRLRQIILNLMGNAIKFTETGYVLTRIVGMEEDEGRYDLHICIEDTGIGIPDDKIEHVFGEFKQVDEEENRKFEGTGLGLAISKKLVTLMGGEIWCDSVYGEGSSFGFRISLPRADKESIDIPKIKQNINRALIVDDVEQNRIILQKQLGHLGIQADTVESGPKALAYWQAHKDLDLIITDHQMPEMNGVEFAKKLRAQKFEATLIAMSSQVSIRELRENKALFDASFQKPTLRHELYRSLGAFLDHQDGQGYYEDEADPLAEAKATKLRLLLAEDNKTNQLVFKKMIKDFNIELRIANNGIELVEGYKEDRPDFIITDISMPEMDGMEACQIIRGLEADEGLTPLQIIALTAHVMPGDREKFLACGMNSYLTKPLKKKALTDEISSVIDLLKSDGAEQKKSA
ncbi:MAG: response regulator [Pseudomonadota bacterium]